MYQLLLSGERSDGSREQTFLPGRFLCFWWAFNSVVECYLAKVDVDGSNPFARSIYLAA
jgi:hypothetical protein